MRKPPPLNRYLRSQERRSLLIVPRRQP